MTTESRQTENLTLLGKKTEYPHDYAPQVLEAFTNKHPGRDYWVRFNCPEFTSLCPITGQPDFATIQIDYIPDVKMVESKSLKLYLFSFRNHGAFHEDCVNIIMNDLIALMNPRYIEVTGFSRRVEASAYIHTATTVVPVRSMSNWHVAGSLNISKLLLAYTPDLSYLCTLKVARGVCPTREIGGDLYCRIGLLGKKEK